MTAPTFQVSLDNIAITAFTVGANLVHASTTDNVPPLVVSACEQLGNTLAMSEKTMLSIEQSVVPTSPSAVASLFKNTFGLSASDGLAALSKSLAGVRFLCLAAAVISTLGTLEGAQAVQAALAKAAPGAAVPPLLDVRELLIAIGPGCLRSNFAGRVDACERQLEPHFAHLRKDVRERLMLKVPGRKGVEAMIEALGELRRGGARVTVRTSCCVPWVVAFVKWCLAESPSILWEDGTSILHEGENKAVSVVVLSNSNLRDGILVSLHSQGLMSDLCSLSANWSPFFRLFPGNP